MAGREGAGPAAAAPRAEDGFMFVIRSAFMIEDLKKNLQLNELLT